jgi:ssDNA-binding Zn-finger/Zn-ribbon topoisomerase 1
VVCGKEETREIPSKGGHSFASWVTLEDATCIKDGIQTRTCTQCGEVEQITNPKSDKYHRYGNWVVIQEPSCNTKGLSVQRCQVCSAELNKQSIPASDKYHKPGDWVVTREPTANEYGEEARICPECGKAQETRRINKLPATEEISTEKPSDNPQTGEPASGCNSTVGFGSAIVISLIFTCSAFFFKRKEN